AAVVLQQPAVDIVGPSDIGAVAALAEAAQDVDVAGQLPGRRFRHRHGQPPSWRVSTSTALSICGSLPAAYSSGKGTSMVGATPTPSSRSPSTATSLTASSSRLSS